MTVPPRRASTGLTAMALALALTLLGAAAPRAHAQGAGEAPSWRLEKVLPPQLTGESAEEHRRRIPVGLGKIGDIEFWAPNRGLLITAGNPPTVPPGVWAYNGAEWHELSDKCGATDGRIAWAGPDEFWTVSDGRPGQTSESKENINLPPLEDNTLCHFSNGQIAGSYAHPAFQADSYLQMHAAGCLDPSDCWFAGEPLEEPQIGAFQLHWNGAALASEPYPEEGHAIESMSPLEGILYEGARIAPGDRDAAPNPEPPVIHRLNPEGVLPPFEPETEVPLYAGEERPEALEALDLSTADGTLWGAAGPKQSEGGTPGQLTIVHRVEGFWSQLAGPEHPLGPLFSDLSEEEALLGRKTKPEEVVAREAVLSDLAAEPGGEGAWVALQPPESKGALLTERAVVAHVSPTGEVSEAQALPSSAEQETGAGPRGAATKLVCPAANDCWLATAQGWLYHLTTAAGRAAEAADPDTDPNFAGLITYRPPDQGLPQVAADAPPPDTSGQVEEPPDYGGTFAEAKGVPIESTVQAPLLTDVHSRLVHGSTLELRFHLAVQARVRLLAERHKKLVASTPMRTFAAGERRLLLALNRREWPTKLSLQTHALAPLPSTTVKEAVGGPEHGGGGSNSISTGLTVLPHVPSFAELEQRP
jgi:hypothetical protein